MDFVRINSKKSSGLLPTHLLFAQLFSLGNLDGLEVLGVLLHFVFYGESN